MKHLLITLLMLISSSAALAAQEGPSVMELRAVEVNFYGGITGFDKAGYRALRSSLAGLIADGTLAEFRTHAVGMEGGATLCVELSGDPSLKINAITDVLDIIKPSAISVYNYNLLKSCDSAR